jgi:predicted YcjX-like family ATPase
MANLNQFDSTSSYYLHSSDQPGQILVTQSLNGDNYATWSRAITMALEAENKLVFINGSMYKRKEG